MKTRVVISISFLLTMTLILGGVTICKAQAWDFYQFEVERDINQLDRDNRYGANRSQFDRDLHQLRQDQWELQQQQHDQEFEKQTQSIQPSPPVAPKRCKKKR